MLTVLGLTRVEAPERNRWRLWNPEVRFGSRFGCCGTWGFSGSYCGSFVVVLAHLGSFCSLNCKPRTSLLGSGLGKKKLLARAYDVIVASF